jgi:hypothetical protein
MLSFSDDVVGAWNVAVSFILQLCDFDTTKGVK